MKTKFDGIKKALIWLILPVLLLSFAGCGGGGGGGTAAISGKVIDGPVANASITVYQVTSSGFVKVGTGSTGADGSFSLSIPNYNSSDYYILFVTGGTFDNNGSSTGAPDMVGFLAPGASHQVFITPVTTLIGQMLFSNGALNQNLNSTQVEAALNQMLSLLGQIFQALSGNSLNGISSANPAGQTNLEQLMAELNSILQELANDVSGQSGESYSQALKDLGNYIGKNPSNFGKELGGAASDGGNFSFSNFTFTGGSGGTINISGTLDNNGQSNLQNLEKQPLSSGISNIPATFSITPGFSVWVVDKPATPGTAGSVTKLDSSGNKIGTYTVGNDPDSIAIDKSGNVWVAGDAVVTELDSSGNHLQTCSLNTGDGSAYMDSLDSNYVAADSSGNIWVTDEFGYTYGLVSTTDWLPYGNSMVASHNTDYDWHGAIVELNPSDCSIEKKIDLHTLTNGKTESPGPIAIDPAGNIWVIGVAGPSYTGSYLTGLTPSGSLLYGPFSGSQLSAVAVDTSGNVWDMDNSDGVKAPAGVGEFNATSKTYSEFNAGYGPDTVAIDASGDVWTGGDAGTYAIKWSPSGSQINDYNMGYYALPSQGTIAFDPSGDAWVVPGNGVGGVIVIYPSTGQQAVYSVTSPVAIAISVNAPNNNSGSGNPPGNGSGTQSGGGSSGNSGSSGQFIAWAGSNILDSTDGSHWSLVYNGSSSSAKFTGAAYGDGNFVVAGVAGKGAILASPDGQNWTQAYTSSGSEPVDGLAFDNSTGTFMAIDQYADQYYVSKDGSSWSAYSGNTHGGDVYSIAGAAFGNGVYTVAEVGSMGGYIDSYDGTTWHSQAVSFTPSAAVYTNGYFFVSGNGEYAYSGNGTTWTSVSQAGTEYSTPAYAAAYM